MSVRSTVLSEVSRVAQQHKKSLPPLTDDLRLLESGLDSLSIAVLIASLDERLGLDPFGDNGLDRFPVTLGDFIGCYEHAAA